ncbi:valacyclovir hydrolase-like isoform X2 [Plodia interpunctella]|uniref:valacyclovir hydrolase-like isoform X2 n=1 Tax=Plodia interpunctella TaxID=58824 RepID=UPI002368C655|nr:valacyclovir hydrolase-like isoform X2 [Plodia interpunctella]
MEEKIKIRDYNINYLKVGNGPHNVLCLPGALGTIWTDFQPQVEGFDREKFTLIVWDPPGYGKSRPPDKKFNENFYEIDADYAAEFMKELQIPKYSLLGWSDGGNTGMILAAKHQAAVQKLVVWGSNSFILPNDLDLCKSVKDVSKWSKKMREPMEQIYGDHFPQYWADWTDGLIILYEAKDGNICSDILKDIKCPTLILYGEKDPMVDPVHASHLHTHIQGSRLHLYPEGKHNIHLKYAADFNKRVQEFLLQ